MKNVEVRFDEEAFAEYEKLKEYIKTGKTSSKQPTYEQLLSSIDSAIKNIKKNPYYGDLIPKKNISKALERKYGTYKILRIELIGYWRLLYTLIGEEIKIIAFVLEFMNHTRYNKLFGYRKK